MISEGLNINSIEALAEEFTTLSDATIRKAVLLTEVDKAFDIEELFSLRDQLQNS